MFYVLMIIELIIIGISFFLWFQWNKEEGNMSFSQGARESKPRWSEQEFAEPKRQKTPRPQKDSRKKEKKKIQNNELDDDIAWNSFGIVERDKSTNTDRREMDDLFMSDTSQEDDFLSETNVKSSAKNKSIEDEFGDLFSEEEKEQFNGSFDFDTSDKEEKSEPAFNDFSDFENFNIGDEDLSNKASQTSKDDNEDAYDFLKNYEFGEDTNESLDDDIFERARNNKINPKDQNASVEEDFNDWDLSPEPSNIPKKENNNKSSHSKQHSSAIDDEDDDDIFARLQRLSNMMDQQKK